MKLEICPNLLHKETGLLFIGKTPQIARAFIRGYLNINDLDNAKVHKKFNKIVSNIMIK